MQLHKWFPVHEGLWSFQTKSRVLLSQTRSPTMFLSALLTSLFFQRQCWAEMCLQALAEGDIAPPCTRCEAHCLFLRNNISME